MNQRAIFVRDAEPTRDDGLNFARFLDEAAEGFFQFVLGRKAREIIVRAYLQPDNEYSHENAIFAVRDSRIVGMACGHKGDHRHRFSDHPLRHSSGGRYPMRIAVAEFFLSQLKRILEEVPDDDFYLLAIAVDEDVRGLGAGSMLLRAIEDRAVGNKSSRLSLDVTAKNEKARRFYERHGLAAESHWPDVDFIPTILSRMTKAV